MMKNYKDTYQNTLIASGKQNFQGEVTSGFIMKLLEITRENIREAQKEKQRKGELCYHLEM
jgi:hypothetical protein